MSVTKRLAPVTPRIINTKTSGPTARIRRFKKISSRIVGGALTSSQKYNNSASFRFGLLASEIDPRTPPTRKYMTKPIHLRRRKPTARSMAMRIGQALAHVMYRKRKGEKASLPANKNAAVITAAKQQPAITWTKAATQRRRMELR